MTPLHPVGNKRNRASNIDREHEEDPRRYKSMDEIQCVNLQAFITGPIVLSFWQHIPVIYAVWATKIGVLEEAKSYRRGWKIVIDRKKIAPNIVLCVHLVYPYLENLLEADQDSPGHTFAILIWLKPHNDNPFNRLNGCHLRGIVVEFPTYYSVRFDHSIAHYYLGMIYLPRS